MLEKEFEYKNIIFTIKSLPVGDMRDVDFNFNDTIYLPIEHKTIFSDKDRRLSDCYIVCTKYLHNGKVIHLYRDDQRLTHSHNSPIVYNGGRKTFFLFGEEVTEAEWTRYTVNLKMNVFLHK